MDQFNIVIDWDQARLIAMVYALQFAAFTIVALFARGMDAIRWTPELVRSARVNWAFFALNSLIAPLAFMAVYAINSGFEATGIPTVPESFWGFAPAIVPALVAVLVADFADYWSHRLRHVSVLWPMHAVHHSDTDLNYMSWYRAHIIELIVINAGYVVLATWLGADPASVAAVVAVRAIHQQYVHMNVDWTHGPLKYVIASPRFHRWHHADVPEAWDKNFSNIMPLWDKLFGTYYCPGKCDVPLGFEGSPGQSVLGLLVFPFKAWGQMLGKVIKQTDPVRAAR